MNYTVTILIKDQKSEFGTTLQIHNSLCNKGPTYLRRELVPAARLPYKLFLRVAKFENIVLNKHKPESLGFRMFSVSGPMLGNNFSESLKMFKFN